MAYRALECPQASAASILSIPAKVLIEILSFVTHSKTPFHLRHVVSVGKKLRQEIHADEQD